MKKPLKYIYIFPSAVTLLNGFFGFTAIMIASHEPGLRWQFPLIPSFTLSYPTISAWFILFGMVADALDGFVARASGMTSDFGAQLDSLCDAVTFGVAPAFLSYKMFASALLELHAKGFRWANITGRWVLFTAVVYAMCALVRLARFNVESDESAASHMNFAGLPSPAGAGLIVSLIIFHEDFLQPLRTRFPQSAPFALTLEKISLWVIPFVLVIAGVLMVSRITYPHLANQLLRSQKSFSSLIVVILCGLFAIWNFHIALVLGFFGFASYGFGHWAITTVKSKPTDKN